MKTSELTGAALDWAVATADGEDYYKLNLYAPSKLWEQAGLIIEQEKIALHFDGDSPWVGECGFNTRTGETPLEAAMRCYVASKLGDEVEIPKELINEEVTQ